MASGCWRASTPLNQFVIARFGSFNVFQLMRLLLQRDNASCWPTGQRLRFRAELGAGFQGAEITGLQASPTPRRVARFAQDVSEVLPDQITLRTPNYCLASELGPLPVPFLEWVRAQQRVGDGAMAAFLNVFNQRIHVLRYELKLRSLRALDPAMPIDTRYAAQLAALMGLGLPGQQAQIPLPKRAWLGMAGLLVNNRRSAEVVALVLSRYLGVSVRLQTMVGRWRSIEACDRTMLGRHDIRLGQSSLLGHCMWDSQAGVRLEIGRLRFEQVVQLLPLRVSRAGESLPVSRYASFASLIHLLLDRRHDCDVQIEVAAGSVPSSHLNCAGHGIGLRLGQTAWLITDGVQQRPTPTFIGPMPLGMVSAVRFRVNAYDVDMPCSEVAA
jgi:type VI secretion system protein ImpH